MFKKNPYSLGVRMKHRVAPFAAVVPPARTDLFGGPRDLGSANHGSKFEVEGRSRRQRTSEGASSAVSKRVFCKEILTLHVFLEIYSNKICALLHRSKLKILANFCNHFSPVFSCFYLFAKMLTKMSQKCFGLIICIAKYVPNCVKSCQRLTSLANFRNLNDKMNFFFFSPFFSECQNYEI